MAAVHITTMKKTIPKVLKDHVWARCIGDMVGTAKCLCCGINEIKMNSFHCGHIVAEANGGSLDIDNLRPICASCNLSMGTEHMTEFRKRCGFSKYTEPTSDLSDISTTLIAAITTPIPRFPARIPTKNKISFDDSEEGKKN